MTLMARKPQKSRMSKRVMPMPPTDSSTGVIRAAGGAMTCTTPVTISAVATASPTALITAAIIACLALLGWPTPAKAQGTSIPWVPLYFVNASGALCSGCLLDTFVTGTTTPLATYSDSALTVANANPVVMGSDGRPTSGGIFLSATSYRFRLRTAGGATIWTYDGITAIPTTSGDVDVSGVAGEALSGGQGVYLSDGSGSLTAGRWYTADSDNTYSSTTAALIGFAPTAIASGASGTIRLAGRVTGLAGLTAGELYYVSSTAGAVTATPPTNARFMGKADSTTVLIVGGGDGALRLPDSDGTHSLVVRTSSNLTADRLLTIVPGDAARTLTISTDVTLDQNIATTSTPSFNRPHAPGGRCTLTSGTAVTTANVTAATTLYYTPYSQAANPNQITLYDGSARWVTLTLSELSIAVPATTNTMYDVFIDYAAGTHALEAVAWTNDTTRATALATQNGVYVQTADTDSLYVCSFRTTGVSGQTEDSFAKRYVWNYYNRVSRAMRRLVDTDTWTYGTQTLRQWNDSTANQVEFVIGVAEEELNVLVVMTAQADTVGDTVWIGIGLDSTTAYATGTLTQQFDAAVANSRLPLMASLRTYPAVGYHYVAGLEASSATGTFQGDGGTTAGVQSGIHATIRG